MGKAHVDIYRRTDPVMLTLEDRAQFDRVIYGRTDAFATPTSEASWQIWCSYYDGTVLRTVFANNAKYTEIWDDRVSLFSALPAGDTYPGTTVSGALDSTSPISGGRVSIIPLTNAAWAPIPAVSVPGRQGISVQNLSGSDILLNWDNTAPGNVGVLIGDGSERYYSARASATLYARFSTLAAGSITVEELYT